MSNRVLVLQDIVKALSHETDTSEALCQSFVKELFAIVAERLMDGESVTLKGVGRFDVDGGEVRFVADPDTAAAINSAFDCFEAIELADDFDGDEPVAEDETPDAAEEESATTADDAAGTEDVADESPADGAEPEEKESQTDGLEESEADSEEEKKKTQLRLTPMMRLWLRKLLKKRRRKLLKKRRKKQPKKKRRKQWRKNMMMSHSRNVADAVSLGDSLPDS